MLWDEFKEYCEEDNYKLVNAIAIALGKQQLFEEYLSEGKTEENNFGLYLQTKMRQALDSCRADKERNHKSENQVDIVIEDDARQAYDLHKTILSASYIKADKTLSNRSLY